MRTTPAFWRTAHFFSPPNLGRHYCDSDAFIFAIRMPHFEAQTTPIWSGTHIWSREPQLEPDNAITFAELSVFDLHFLRPPCKGR